MDRPNGAAEIRAQDDSGAPLNFRGPFASLLSVSSGLTGAVLQLTRQDPRRCVACFCALEPEGVGNLIEVFVESIRVNMANYKRVVMLKEKHSTRYLPIWIGHFEADAIAIPMQKVPVSRPLTHDLLRLAISALGAKLEKVIINDLADETFFAKLILDQDGKVIEVDARPSDAIALAIRTEVPIFVEERVLDTAGMVFDGEAESDGEPKEREESTPIDEEKLSVFRQFINTLDIDDSEKGEKGGEGKQ